MDDEEEKAFFSNWDQSSSNKPFSTKERRKRSVRIFELKKRTQCKKCNKSRHLERECFEDKKHRPIEIMAVKSTDAKGCKANAVVTENFDEDDSSTFMVHDAEHVDDADA
uniref:CCHC-type domain-containing protein n=1 Tax=Physcomitrium patens TaxID=3218 RepID=A0A2K1K5P2_PHYPA|nr:hypothetical protein PHYPA_010983 [Physcomitrium patens]